MFAEFPLSFPFFLSLNSIENKVNQLAAGFFGVAGGAALPATLEIAFPTYSYSGCLCPVDLCASSF
jgi:hypothetical protein